MLCSSSRASPSGCACAGLKIRDRTTSFNPTLGLRRPSVPTSSAGIRCGVKLDPTVGASARYRYMYTALEERAASMEKGLLDLQVIHAHGMLVPCRRVYVLVASNTNYTLF